jgi:hypothetical protein
MTNHYVCRGNLGASNILQGLTFVAAFIFSLFFFRAPVRANTPHRHTPWQIMAADHSRPSGGSANHRRMSSRVPLLLVVVLLLGGAVASTGAAADGRRRDDDQQRRRRPRDGRTHYDVLELDVSSSSSSVTLTDVKKAYRRLAVRYHPDRNIGNEEEATVRFREINEAYEILSNEDSRREYDAHIRRGDGNSLINNKHNNKNNNHGGGRWTFRAGGGGGSDRLSRRRRGSRDPFDQFNDVFRNDPFFAESFRSMDDLFARKFDNANDDRGGGGGVNEGNEVDGEGGWGGGYGV